MNSVKLHFQRIFIISFILIPIGNCHTFLSFLAIPFETEIRLMKSVRNAFFPSSGSTATYGILNEKGKYIHPMSKTWLASYSEGLGAAAECDKKGKNCKYGYRDTDLNWVIPPRFETYPGDFKDGIALYPRPPYGSFNRNYKYINKKGEFLFGEKSFKHARDFEFGYARVALREERDTKTNQNFTQWGWIDKSGKVYDFNEPLLDNPEKTHHKSILIREGMVPCPNRDENGELRWGFKNLNGDWVVKPKYYSVHPYYFGKAFVQVERGLEFNIFVLDQFELIDKTGKNLFPDKRFQSIEPPNHRGLGSIKEVPEPGVKSSPSYLFNWKTMKQSDFSVITITSYINPNLWNEKWIWATHYKNNPDGKLQRIGAYYDENFQPIQMVDIKGIIILHTPFPKIGRL